MLELLSGLSAFAGVFALLSPKTPIARMVFNKIGISNEFLIRHHIGYNKILLAVTISMILLTLFSIIAYLDYSKFVLLILYVIMFSGFFTILSSYSRIVDHIQKRSDTKNRRFLSSYGNKPLIVLVSTITISAILLATAPSIFKSQEISQLYDNLKENDFPLHTLISNQENTKEEFIIKYENIVKLTQKAQLLQDYERYYKEGVSFTCDSFEVNSNHSKIKSDMFFFVCNNFDSGFREIYIPQFEKSYFGKRGGLPPESYPLNWLIKYTENQSYNLSRFIVNIRLVIGNSIVFISNKIQSTLNVIIGIVIFTLCYLGAVKIYKYNSKYDKESTSPKFIFYSIFTLISLLSFMWSISI
ncbi:MAG: hypothetical protein P1U56_17450 [Saprospiraceae bacterium]|nr:hypothetical protein [Saprospiraceae bacterium]